MPQYFRTEGEVCGLRTTPSNALVQDISLSNKALNNCYVPLAPDPSGRAMFWHIELRQIHHWACSAHGAAFDEVTVTDLRGGGRARSFLWGCAYRHVTLRGWISGLMFRWQADLENDRIRRTYHEANLSLYKEVDWAIDVREARFSFLEALLGVPPQLVRRNPETQFVLSSESAQKIMETEPISVWRVVAEDLLKSGMPGVVIVLGGTAQQLTRYLQDAARLRDRGLLS